MLFPARFSTGRALATAYVDLLRTSARTSTPNGSPTPTPSTKDSSRAFATAPTSSWSLSGAERRGPSDDASACSISRACSARSASPSRVETATAVVAGIARSPSRSPTRIASTHRRAGPSSLLGASTADDYVKKAREFSKVMKLTDPSIELISCG